MEIGKEKVFSSKMNPEKASARVAITGVMLASLFVTLAVIFLEPHRFPMFAIAQMVLAIPFLFISNLSYSKIGYWEKTKAWDIFGYFTNTMGVFLMINSVGLLVSTISVQVAFLYFSLIALLMFIYSSINITYRRKRWHIKVLKFLFIIVLLFLGGILPLL